MQRSLSVRATPFLKFVLPPVWVALVGYVGWRLWADPSYLVAGETGVQTQFARWLLLALIAASLVVLLAFVVPLKRVRLVDTGLQISNYLRETTVPFDAILGVRQNWLPTFRLISLELRSGTSFPRRVVFMPAGTQRLAFWRRDYWREDAVVGELRRRARLPLED
jgi:hypothetical protein